jgi:hypothetical protein
MRVLSIEAYFALVKFDCCLRRKNFRALCDSVHNYPVGENTAASPAESICRAVDVASIWYWKEVRCLQRAAATCCLLRRHGIAAEMVIGARLLPFQAHAWVEVKGRVVNDKSYSREIYNVLDRF